ncbi:MAG: hypothetical protein LBJ92_03850 [Holosporales bacterium]|jgi:hypothetical protein|nr:hypothetical protein [Holosporales bacterium]
MEGKTAHRPAVYLDIHQETDYGELGKGIIMLVVSSYKCITANKSFIFVLHCMEIYIFRNSSELSSWYFESELEYLHSSLVSILGVYY